MRLMWLTIATLFASDLSLRINTAITLAAQSTPYVSCFPGTLTTYSYWCFPPWNSGGIFAFNNWRILDNSVTPVAQTLPFIW
jgi:hypothetical protein